MKNFKLWAWDKKPRTMLRFIKPGDIFCFQLDDKKYGFGRIISKVSIGHSAEIFDHFSSSPGIDESALNLNNSLFLLILDTYSLFDKKFRVSGELLDMGIFLKLIKIHILSMARLGRERKLMYWGMCLIYQMRNQKNIHHTCQKMIFT
ncbi:Imm26 family immunity protein [Erwinia mallotivora]|uniref:Imm26 family immunity protein n=1 Tax=Erwinia mallotivora TaxID=69222 RepID=UPI0004B46F66|nr:Imm26 family immunity protein [Erwinia mallotivora]